MASNLEILIGDCRETLKTLPDESVQCVVTSPPYWGLRDYCGNARQIGLERNPSEYTEALVSVFREVMRVLKGNGTLWVNLGDAYCSTDKWGGGKSGNSGKHTRDGADVPSWAVRKKKEPIPGVKPKDLIGLPWRFAFAMQADGWYLRQDIIWHKPNSMPESVKDRCTKAHEYLFLLTKSERYYFDADAIKEPAICGSNGSEFHTGKTGVHQLGRSQKVRPSAPKGSFNGKTEVMAAQGLNAFRAITDYRNKRSVWSINTAACSEAHFATFPPDLVKPCVLAGSRPGDTILDPFGGSGTTGMVALELGRKAILCELNPEYVEIAKRRTDVTPGFAFNV